MAWQGQDAQNNSDESPFIKFKTLEKVDEYDQVRMRIISGDPDDPASPAHVWVHWLDNRPFNCPRGDCPVCIARKAAAGSPTQKTDFRLNCKYMFNVLVDGKMKVFSFGFGVGRDLKQFSEVYGPLTGYDITVRKTKTGRLPQNVEYNVFKHEDREITTTESPHELTEFLKPASYEDLVEVAKGKLPLPKVDSEQARLLGEIKSKIPSDLSVSHFGVDENTNVEALQQVLDSLA